MENRLIDLIDRLDRRTGADGAYQIALNYYQDIGFRYVNVGLASVTDESYLGVFSNMRPAWLDYYVSEGFAGCDVIFDYAIANSQARLCSPQSNLELPSTDKALSDRMLTEILEEGFASSLVLPRHSRLGGRLIGFNLGTSLAEVGLQNLIRSEESAIMIGAALTQTAILEDFEDGALGEHWYPTAPMEAKLSPREVEVLKWLSGGLRNDRIAEKLGISLATVNFHVVSAKQKLGAQTREHAVATAILNRLI